MPAVEIRTIQKLQEYEVNGKNVYKDSNGNFVAREELTESEHVAFRNELKRQQANDKFYSRL
jgi:hypothetical protein